MINSFFILKALLVLNLFRMGVFWGAHGLDGGVAKRFPSLKSVTHLAMMELGTLKAYLKKIQKLYEHVTHTLSSADISIFSPEI